jgi:hypothetical protein
VRRRTKVLLLLLVALAPFAFAAGWATWAAVTSMRYGHASAGAHPDALLEPFIPRYEVAERHERIVAASPADAFRAVQSVRLEDSRAVRAIFRGRELILRQPAAPESPIPFLEVVRSIGWGVLDSVPGRELVFGAVAQPWRGDVTFRALPRDRFAAFDSAGYAKIVWSIAVDSLGPRRTRVRTETRVATTDPASRALFRRYWSVFSPGIVLIRYELLRVIDREAGRGAQPQG